ncbi:MAG TPA: serine/threonine-protein kinase [Gaiellaceae bacterium]|nr:serine/threonine-protein kinase [Gaiellaceae bacterium]
MSLPTQTLPRRYRDPRPIGSGGMGRIYRAHDDELGRDVAIKVLADRYAVDDALRARFRREALAAARLSGNPNIVTIFDVAEHDGRPMIVMEYLSGGSLEERARGHNGCPPAQVLEWLEQAANAIDAAHAAGVIHRDIKPGNLLLDANDHVHVADFGIASAAGLDSFTKTGTILGTAGYLAPEQARGERATAASDLYSLAVVAYELLSGRRPYEGESPTAEAAAHAAAPIPSIHAANPELPRALDRVFRRALAKDPAARYRSAAEFVAELRHALHEAAGDTGWIVPAPRTAVTQVAAPAAARREGPPRRLAALPPRRRRNWWPLLLLALLVAGGVAAAVLATRPHSTATTAPPRPRTVVRTVTAPGTTQTVTAAAPPAATTAATATTTQPATTQPATTAPTGGASGADLNNAGYARMQAGDFAGALPLLEQAVQKLTGANTLDEAYADFNLAYTRFQLGQCTDVLALLDRSQSIQGPRPEIDHLRHDARKSCGGGPGNGNGDGNGNGNG